jgi:hypothetical protein
MYLIQVTLEIPLERVGYSVKILLGPFLPFKRHVPLYLPPLSCPLNKINKYTLSKQSLEIPLERAGYSAKIL